MQLLQNETLATCSTCEHADTYGKDSTALLSILQIGNVNPIFVSCKVMQRKNILFLLLCNVFSLMLCFTFTFNLSLSFNVCWGYIDRRKNMTSALNYTYRLTDTWHQRLCSIWLTCSLIPYSLQSEHYMVHYLGNRYRGNSDTNYAPEIHRHDVYWSHKQMLV